MSFRHGDPLDDFDRYDAYQARQEARCPICDNPRCKKRIQDDFFVIDGEILCYDCTFGRYGQRLEDYLDD
jgi:hypothetical protein